MPKQIVGVSKSNRVLTLLEVLKRWGKLNKSQINQHVASILNCDPNEIARSLYRDLEELVSRGEISVRYYSSDGKEIESYDAEIHKNSTAEWFIQSNQNAVLGEGALRKLGGAFFVSDRLKRSFFFEQGEKDFTYTDKRKLFFRLNQNCFCIQFSLDDAPTSVVIVRMPNDLKEAGACFQEIEKTLGKRSAVLFLPIPGISGFKASSRLGHFMIKIETEDVAYIKDLNSKNGTYIHPLDLPTTKEWIRTERLHEGSTMSTALNPTDKFRQISKKIPFMEDIPISIPSLVIASHPFSMTVF